MTSASGPSRSRPRRPAARWRTQPWAPGAWATFTGMAEGWEGTLGQVVEASAALSG
jgi:hypothetical protein